MGLMSRAEGGQSTLQGAVKGRLRRPRSTWEALDLVGEGGAGLRPEEG